MSDEIPPVIRRDMNDNDREATVLHTVKDDTRFVRGLGDVGDLVQHVEHECPCCGNGEMIRIQHIYPDDDNYMKYWCLMPSCRYFVSDEISWATKPHPDFVPDTPMVWQNSAECPDCGSLHSVVCKRNSRRHDLSNEGSSCIINEQCSDCKEEQNT